MKIGFYGESPADQAALAVFTEGILGEPPEPINMDLEAHGVTGILTALDGVFRGVHYNSDAEGVVVDEADRADGGTVVLHHPVLLGTAADVEEVAADVRKIHAAAPQLRHAQFDAVLAGK